MRMRMLSSVSVRLEAAVGDVTTPTVAKRHSALYRAITLTFCSKTQSTYKFGLFLCFFVRPGRVWRIPSATESLFPLRFVLSSLTGGVIAVVLLVLAAVHWV